jgi:hypothetical protein
VAEAVRTPPADDPNPSGHLDEIEVIYVGEGSEPGLRMTWHQGADRFGLLNSVGRLAEQAGGLDALPFYLRLAIDEPHGPVPHASRQWFLALPSAPN